MNIKIWIPALFIAAFGLSLAAPVAKAKPSNQHPALSSHDETFRRSNIKSTKRHDGVGQGKTYWQKSKRS